MNLRDEITQLKTGVSELRKFGLVVGGVFAALGGGLMFWHRPSGPYLLTVGGLLLGLGLVAPRTLKYIYIGWMFLAIVLGFIMSGLLLTLFFFFVITPVGWAARCFGNDFLSLKLDRSAASYWIRRECKPKAQAEYERQF